MAAERRQSTLLGSQCCRRRELHNPKGFKLALQECDIIIYRHRLLPTFDRHERVRQRLMTSWTCTVRHIEIVGRAHLPQLPNILISADIFAECFYTNF